MISLSRTHLHPHIRPVLPHFLSIRQYVQHCAACFARVSDPNTAFEKSLDLDSNLY